ncbi:hypothetical protein ACVWU4_001028 [Campylobacter coli]
MEAKKYSDFIKNKNKISDLIKKVGNITYVTDDCYVLFPIRFTERKLASLGNTTRVLGMLALVNNNNQYATINSSIFLDLTPSNISSIMIDNDEYVKLEFHKDSVFMPNDKCIKSDQFLYNIFEEFIIKGNIPFYLDYEELSNIISNSKILNNNTIGDDPIAMEILTYIIARTRENKDLSYREALHKGYKYDPEFIALGDIIFSFSSVGAKLIGGYFSAGIGNAIVQPETQSNKTTDILRR